MLSHASNSTLLKPYTIQLPLHNKSPLQQQEEMKNNNNSNKNKTFNLERILQQYASQPDLLELILSSKVEEDRRRAEEAKLKNKEIDYLIQQQQLDQNENDTKCQTWRKQSSSSLSSSSPSPPPPSTLQPLPISSSLSSSSSSSSSSSPSTLGKRPSTSSPMDWSNHHHHHHHPSAIILPPLTSPPMSHSSVISPKLSSHDINYKNSIQHITSPSSFTELSFDGKKENNNKKIPISPFTPPSSFQAPPSPPNEKHPNMITPSSSSSSSSSSSITTTHSTSISSMVSKSNKRRRREMQPVTAIIETREFPYNDNYLWRNNGNTIHKKTGYKSIYYKCANSHQNCPVNKTTLFKGNGEYLIKYRGHHLPDCSTIKRINEI
ncbi:unnamed protein product [Cunninghamella echinulata]